MKNEKRKLIKDQQEFFLGIQKRLKKRPQYASGSRA